MTIGITHDTNFLNGGRQGGPVIAFGDRRPDSLDVIDQHGARGEAVEIGMAEPGVGGGIVAFESGAESGEG